MLSDSISANGREVMVYFNTRNFFTLKRVNLHVVFCNSYDRLSRS